MMRFLIASELIAQEVFNWASAAVASVDVRATLSAREDDGIYGQEIDQSRSILPCLSSNYRHQRI
jgi:hypothetical protein